MSQWLWVKTNNSQLLFGSYFNSTSETFFLLSANGFTFLHPVTSISIKNVCWLLAFLYYSLWWWTGLPCLDFYLLVALPTHSVSWTCSWRPLSVALFAMVGLTNIPSLVSISVLFGYFFGLCKCLEISKRFRFFTFFNNIIIFRSQLFKYLISILTLDVGTLCHFISVKIFGYKTNLFCGW